MLFAGIWTFLQLVKPLLRRIHGSINALGRVRLRAVVKLFWQLKKICRIPVIIFGVIGVSIGLYFLFEHLFALSVIGFTPEKSIQVISNGDEFMC